MGVEAVGPHGELDHGEAAEVDGAGCIEAVEHGRRPGRAEIAPDAGAAARDLAGAVVHVLVGERHACERARGPAAVPVTVHIPRFGQRVLPLETDEGVKLGVQPVDAGERRLHQIGGGERAVSDGVRRLAEAERRDLAALACRARAGLARIARIGARSHVALGGPQCVQRLLEGGGQPVEVVVGPRGLDRRVKLAQLDGKLGHPLVRERDVLAFLVQPFDRLAADRHGPLRHAFGAASATLRQNASSHQRRAAPEVDGSTWIAVAPMRCVCCP